MITEIDDHIQAASLCSQVSYKCITGLSTEGTVSNLLVTKLKTDEIRQILFCNMMTGHEEIKYWAFGFWLSLNKKDKTDFILYDNLDGLKGILAVFGLYSSFMRVLTKQATEYYFNQGFSQSLCQQLKEAIGCIQEQRIPDVQTKTSLYLKIINSLVQRKREFNINDIALDTTELLEQVPRDLKQITGYLYKLQHTINLRSQYNESFIILNEEQK